MRIIIKSMLIKSRIRIDRREWYWELWLSDKKICGMGEIDKPIWPHSGGYSQKHSAIKSAKRFKIMLNKATEVEIVDKKGKAI